MSADEWERAKQIFEAALDEPVAGRTAYLDAACAGNAGLRQTVSDLLAAHDTINADFLEGGARSEGGPSFREGDRIANRFRVVRFIAGGGMGEVYEVFDEQLRLHVALKAIRADFARDPEACERFKREVWVTRDVAHESICRVFDFVEHRIQGANDSEGQRTIPCLTMQLLHGEGLDQHLRRGGALSPADALPWIRQIANALGLLHRKRIVHRDLKPSNVILEPQPDGSLRPVLTDFGLAKPVEGGSFESRSSIPFGAPYYMAPELLRGERPTPASDIYALGLLIDDMVTTSRAFPHGSMHTLLVEKNDAGPIRPSLRSTGLPDRWERVILRCLSDEPERRYPRAEDLVAALEGADEDGGVLEASAEVIEDASPAPLQMPSARRRRRLLILVIAASVGVAVLILFLRASRPSMDTSVIVFPFVNLTTLAEYNEVADGFSAELVPQLRTTKGLTVYGAPRARQAVKTRLVNSAFSIDGSLGRARDLTLSVRLFENEHNTVIWESTFEGKSEEFLTWQQDIVGNLLRAIVRWSGLGVRAPELAGWPSRVAQAPLDWFLRPRFASPPDPPTTNSAAYEPYLRASGLSTAHTFGALFEAERQLQKALSIDPGFVLAHTALANNQLALLDSGVRLPSELIGRARSHGEKAMDLQGKQPEALLALGAVRQALLDWDGATEAYRRAIQVDPQYAPAMRGQASVMLAAGRIDECARLSRLALDKDPYDERTHTLWADCSFLSGKPLIAIQQLETAVALGGAAPSRYSLVRMYAYLLQTSSGTEKDLYSHKAMKELANLRKAESDLWSGIDRPPILRYSDHADALFKAASGDRSGAEALRNALERANNTGHISAFELAELAAATGDEAEALRLLEAAVQKREWRLVRLNSSPFFKDLRGTPQFRSLAGKVGLAK